MLTISQHKDNPTTWLVTGPAIDCLLRLWEDGEITVHVPTAGLGLNSPTYSASLTYKDGSVTYFTEPTPGIEQELFSLSGAGRAMAQRALKAWNADPATPSRMHLAQIYLLNKQLAALDRQTAWLEEDTAYLLNRANKVREALSTAVALLHQEQARPEQ